MLTVSIYGGKLYDFRLHPTTITYADMRHPLEPSNSNNHQVLPDLNYDQYILSLFRNVDTFIPLFLLKPVVHLVYQYRNDELTSCPDTFPVSNTFKAITSTPATVHVSPNASRLPFRYRILLTLSRPGIPP
ncbi:hypothetical protein P9112_013100 [Eukaryota sp. TZLM1-RC]